MKKFSEIEQFRHVVKHVHLYYEQIGKTHDLPTLTFNGTVKLHGTNAGLRRFKGKYQPQSRSRILDPTNDNYEFAAFIESVPKKSWNILFNKIANEWKIGRLDEDCSYDTRPPTNDITLYGEWIGKNIQSDVGISQLDHRQWVIFGLWVNGQYARIRPTACGLSLWDADLIKHNVYDISDIPQFTVDVDFSHPEKALPEIQKYTDRVAKQCPWAERWKIKGPGEGIVWTCVQHPTNSDLWFKTKNEKFMASNTKKRIAIDPEKVKNIEEYVELVITENRLNQGLEYLKEMSLELEPKNIGSFLMWIAKDIKKEEEDTLTTNRLVWKDVHKTISRKAREFILKKIKEDLDL